MATENRIESYVYLEYRQRRIVLMENVLFHVGLTGGIQRALPTQLVTHTGRIKINVSFLLGKPPKSCYRDQIWLHALLNTCNHETSASSSQKTLLNQILHSSGMCHRTYLLTPWRRVLLQKLTGSQLVKTFHEFYAT